MSPLLSILASAAEGAAKASAHSEPSGLSTLGGVIAMIVTGIGLIAVGGVAAMMMVGAINGRRQLVTSWSMEQEASFTSYEQKTQQGQSKAWTAALISAAAVGVIAIGIYFGVKPDMRDQEKAAKSMNMSNLTKKEKDAAPAPAAAPAEKKAAEATPAETKKAEEPAEEKTEEKEEEAKEE